MVVRESALPLDRRVDGFAMESHHKSSGLSDD
jgi:hypothetical protein